MLAEGRDSLLVRASRLAHVVPETGHQVGKVDGDHRLVLDDEDVGRDLLGDLGRRLVDESLDAVLIGFEDERGVGGREFLHRHEQKSLAGSRRDRLELAVGRGEALGRMGVDRLLVEADRVPDLKEGLVGRDPRLKVHGECGGLGSKRFEHSHDVSVAAGLTPRQNTCKPPQIRQLRRDNL